MAAALQAGVAVGAADAQVAGVQRVGEGHRLQRLVAHVVAGEVELRPLSCHDEAQREQRDEQDEGGRAAHQHLTSAQRRV